MWFLRPDELRASGMEGVTKLIVGKSHALHLQSRGPDVAPQKSRGGGRRIKALTMKDLLFVIVADLQVDVLYVVLHLPKKNKQQQVLRGETGRAASCH